MAPITRVVDHPVAQHKLSVLRDLGTTSRTFRQVLAELGGILAVTATDDMPLTAVTVTTPVGATTETMRVSEPAAFIVPVLRAGIGLLEPFLALLPHAEVGAVGMIRDEVTLRAEVYAERLPTSLEGRRCFVLDPMIATGSTLGTTCNLLQIRDAASITAVSVVATEQGILRAREFAPELSVVTVSMDAQLDEAGFIWPGLGDAGDRLYGHWPD